MYRQDHVSKLLTKKIDEKKNDGSANDRMHSRVVLLRDLIFHNNVKCPSIYAKVF